MSFVKKLTQLIAIKELTEDPGKFKTDIGFVDQSFLLKNPHSKRSLGDVFISVNCRDNSVALAIVGALGEGGVLTLKRMDDDSRNVVLTFSPPTEDDVLEHIRRTMISINDRFGDLYSDANAKQGDLYQVGESDKLRYEVVIEKSTPSGEDLDVVVLADEFVCVMTRRDVGLWVEVSLHNTLMVAKKLGYLLDSASWLNHLDTRFVTN